MLRLSLVCLVNSSTKPIRKSEDRAAVHSTRFLFTTGKPVTALKNQDGNGRWQVSEIYRGFYQGLGSMSQLNITQILGIHLQQSNRYLEVMFKIPKKGHQSQPLRYTWIDPRFPYG